MINIDGFSYIVKLAKDLRHGDVVIIDCKLETVDEYLQYKGAGNIGFGEYGKLFLKCPYGPEIINNKYFFTFENYPFIVVLNKKEDSI